MTTNAGFISSTADHLRGYAERVERRFGPLNELQLNWQPDPNTWSAGLILDHILTTDRSYFPVFRAIAEGTYKMSLWTRISPFSGVLGRSMVKNLGPDPGRKYVSPPAFRPRQSKVSPDIVARFARVQEELIALIRAMAQLPLDKLRIPSPASGFITYSLQHAIRIIDVHTARHLNQADRLMDRSEFPR